MGFDSRTVGSPPWFHLGAAVLMDDEEADAFGIHIHEAADVGLGGLPETIRQIDFEGGLGVGSLLEQPLRPRILLAEDDAEMRHLVASDLVDAGYEVVSCRNGIELLNQISRVSPQDEPVDFDLIISDIRMPGIDGLSLLDALRHWRELRPLQMILMTAFGDEPTHQRSQELGAVALFDKPFEVADLLAKVAELVPSPCALARDLEGGRRRPHSRRRRRRRTAS